MYQSASAGRMYRPRCKVQVHRIYEAPTECGACRRCRRTAPFCFTLQVEGFLDCGLCRRCGIMVNKYPTTYNSEEECFEQPDLIFIVKLLDIVVVLAFLSIIVTVHLLTDFSWVYKTIFSLALTYKIPEYFLSWTFNKIEKNLLVSKSDYFADSFDLFLHQVYELVHEREMEETKYKNQLRDVKKKMADFEHGRFYDLDEVRTEVGSRTSASASSDDESCGDSYSDDGFGDESGPEIRTVTEKTGKNEPFWKS